MRHMGRFKRKFIAIALFTALILITSLSPDFASAASGWLRINPKLSYGQDAQTGATNYLQINYQNSLVKPDSAFLAMPLEARAEQVLERYGVEFGLLQPDVSLEMMQVKTPDPDRGVVRYQQTYKGIPILAGEIIYNENNAGYIQSIHGETSLNLDLSVKADIGAGAAQNTALALIARLYGLSSNDLAVSKAQLWVYDEDLLRKSERPVELVWRMEVTARDDRAPIRELVLVNAHTGGVSLHFNQIDTFWSRTNQQLDSGENAVAYPPIVPEPAPHLQIQAERDTHDGNSNYFLPGTPLCDETVPACTNGTDPHADAAHQYANDTYNYYFDTHGRDSIDDAGLTLISTVHHIPDPVSAYPGGYANAFWSGSQMVYGDAAGFPLADDVVAHELTHGVTQYESGLFYYYQSGAINEAFSDIWGEFVDLGNGAGTDTAGVRWLVGEDVAGWSPLRDMQNPPTYGDPDRIGSPNYYTAEGDRYYGNNDNGGVHFNSGVLNKAAYLLADGDTFNSYTVTGLGIDKVAAIMYEVQTNLLTSGSDYSDLYYAMQQACQNLIGGAEGITSGDCQEVTDAVNAVEMNDEPSVGFNPDADICVVSETPNNLFFDDLEAGGGNWNVAALQGDSLWFILGDGYAVSGDASLWGVDYIGAASDAYASMASSVTLPTNAYLHFFQAFGFENPNYDGGWLEYSTNSGGSWTDAVALFDDGQDYNGTIRVGDGNPNEGHAAFIGDSHGYVSSRYDLSSLAGQDVLFRFRLSKDASIYDWGWFVDDIRIYTCAVPDTETPTVTLTSSQTLTPTFTQTPTATVTETSTVTETLTPTVTDTATHTSTATATQTPTHTNTPVTPGVPSVTPTHTPTETQTPTITATPSPTSTATHTPTATDTVTVTSTATITETPTVTQTSTITDTATITQTPTETETPTVTLTPTITDTPTVTQTPTDTTTPVDTATFTATFTATHTGTTTPASTATRTNTSVAASTKTPTRTSTGGSGNTATSTALPTRTPTITSTATLLGPLQTLTALATVETKTAPEFTLTALAEEATLTAAVDSTVTLTATSESADTKGDGGNGQRSDTPTATNTATQPVDEQSEDRGFNFSQYLPIILLCLLPAALLILMGLFMEARGRRRGNS